MNRYLMMLPFSLPLWGGCATTQEAPVPNYPDCTWQQQRTVGVDELWNGLVTPNGMIAQLDGQSRDWGIGTGDPATSDAHSVVTELDLHLTLDGDPGEYLLLDGNGDASCRYSGPALIAIADADFVSPDSAWEFSGQLPLFYYSDTGATSTASTEVSLDALASPGPLPEVLADAVGSSALIDPLVANACSSDLLLELHGTADTVSTSLCAACPGGDRDHLADGAWNP
jgi:hypothetical protein